MRHKHYAVLWFIGKNVVHHYYTDSLLGALYMLMFGFPKYYTSKELKVY